MTRPEALIGSNASGSTETYSFRGELDVNASSGETEYERYGTTITGTWISVVGAFPAGTFNIHSTYSIDGGAA